MTGGIQRPAGGRPGRGTHYDAVVIGAGLSGLAAGVRLAHFGRKVCIFERHSAVGGLNSFYSAGGRKFDVGLHAVTNFARAGGRGTPLTKVLRQLRIGRDELPLFEQKQSRIAFGPRGEASLRFTNDFAVLEAEVARLFPREIDGFRRLVRRVRENPFSEEKAAISARATVREEIADPLLEDMVLCPVLLYGSAREGDMGLDQFALLFQAIFLEGLARPFDGIRGLLRLLTDKYRAAGGERRMNCGVRRILARGGAATGLVLDSGEVITADCVLSCAGAPETEALIAEEEGGGAPAPPAGRAVPGRIAFVETLRVLDRQPAELGWGDDTIVFFNDSERFDHAVPEGQVDPRSGVVCIPNNFDFGPDRRLPEGIVRITCLANYDRWARLPEETYRADKLRWFGEVQASARRFLPDLPEEDLAAATVATDMFTPRTVERFTGRRNGAIYGSPAKSRGGGTVLRNVHLCGTDEGYVGIVGTLLSGIAMANRHVLASP